MTLFSGLAATGKLIADKAKQAVKDIAAKAKVEFGESLTRPIRDTVTNVKHAVSEGVTASRSAAADAIARGGAGVSTKLAGQIAPKGHWTQSASDFFDLDPDKRTLVYWGLGIAAVILVAVIVRDRA